MSEKRGNCAVTVGVSFLTGALIGAGVALLFAPVTGKDAREIIGDKMEDMKEEIKKLEEKLVHVKKNFKRESDGLEG